jgi:hypothetical protein
MINVSVSLGQPHDLETFKLLILAPAQLTATLVVFFFEFFFFLLTTLGVFSATDDSC